MAAFTTITFVSRDRIDFYINGKISSFPLSPLVRDLEIIDKLAFKSQLSAFLEKNGGNIGNFAILLSETICFISEPITDKQKIEEAFNNFQSTLPFDIPVAKILGDKIVGTNKDFYETVIEAMEQKGGKVVLVSPAFLSKEMIGKINLDGTMVKFVLSNEDEFIKASFAYDAPVFINSIPVNQNESQNFPKKRTKRETILIGVFVGLLSIFLIWLLTRLL